MAIGKMTAPQKTPKAKARMIQSHVMRRTVDLTVTPADDFRRH